VAAWSRPSSSSARNCIRNGVRIGSRGGRGATPGEVTTGGFWTAMAQLLWLVPDGSGRAAARERAARLAFTCSEIRIASAVPPTISVEMALISGVMPNRIRE
jgi:hypothetical protein